MKLSEKIVCVCNITSIICIVVAIFFMGLTQYILWSMKTGKEIAWLEYLVELIP